LREFLSSYAAKFNVYIWSFTMRRNFSKHLEIIRERSGGHLDPSRIVHQALLLKNEHFLLKKPILHENLNAFFSIFPNTNCENTCL
jgi:hypothetical protein